MLKSALGAGLLTFPWAFEKAGGIHLAVTVELASRCISLVFLISGLVILGYSSSISGQNTYQAVVTYMCGPSLGKLCEICYVFNLFIISVAFLVIVADQLETLCISMYELITGLPESEMPYHCVIGTFAAAYLTVAITVKYHTRPVHEINLSPIYSSGSMKNRNLSHWVFISVVSMFICLIIYSLTGIYGYLTFGKNVAPDILMSYSGGDVTMIIARLLFGISIITIYPIIVLLGRSVIQDPLLKRRRKHTVVTESYESRTRIALTTVWVTVTLLIAVFVPDISKVISVVGGISAFFIFIFPGLCLIFAVQSESVSPTLR
ncbi:putative sodium-coupled neutral amino acid transporter 8 [Triplophysa tibetana]|uniref:Putative sodium-coupled neutral amino acid transporter 8 n=1 Tax=Triplophysa tibetana TaxID=1572043 RepID=A0A5A9NYN8_9TELE|nr:putative sodium-coupled neutral amino acid transporter 8 [Triplophysa tibetana]